MTKKLNPFTGEFDYTGNGMESGVIQLQGDWNASTNTPDISGTSTPGYGWRVSVEGTTNLGGITSWKAGDVAVKTATGWLKIDNQDVSALRGNIGGTLANQTDLKNALDGKMNTDGTNSNVGKMQFNTAYTPTGTELAGSIYRDADSETYVGVVNNGVKYNFGQELGTLVQNDTGNTILDGQPVMYASSVGASGNIRVQLAIADGTIPFDYMLGLATQDIINGDRGMATRWGKVNQVPIANIKPSGETWVAGDILYVSATEAGKLTKTIPQAPNGNIFVGGVVAITATHVTIDAGIILPKKLVNLADVDGTPLNTNGQILVWDNDRGVFDFTDNINTFKPASFYAGAMTVNKGTLNAGTVADLQAVGGTDVVIQEASGADPLRVIFAGTGIAKLSAFVFYGYYAGGSGHQIDVELYNYNTTNRDIIGVVGSEMSKKRYSFPIFNVNAYISATNAQVRFRHVQTGNATHQLILDYMEFNYGSTGGGSNVSAASVTYVPSGNISATNVAAALAELDTEKAGTSVASTSANGLEPQATAPAAGNLNVEGIANGETARSDKLLLDTTAPNGLLVGGTNVAGTSLKAARTDHTHAIGIDSTGGLFMLAKTASIYGVCSTDIGTSSKTLSIVNYQLVVGGNSTIQLTNGNSAASPTLNINSTGAKPIWLNGAAVGNIPAGALLDLIYDGTNYNILNVAIFGATAPTTQAFGDTAVAGTSWEYAHVDHKHAMPASTKDTTAVTGILKGNGTAISAAAASDITGQTITGFTSGAGTVAATDTILQAINKLDGNVGTKLNTSAKATSSDINTGTDDTKYTTSDGIAGSTVGKRFIQIPLGGVGDAVTTGDGKNYRVCPTEFNGWNVVGVYAYLGTVSSSGTPTYQLRNATDSVDILSTRVTIDANEYTSFTAATAAVIDTTKDDLATGDRIYVDKDVAGTGEKGDVFVIVVQLP